AGAGRAAPGGGTDQSQGRERRELASSGFNCGVKRRDCRFHLFISVSVLAVHRCTAGNWAKSYAESWEIRQTADLKLAHLPIHSPPPITALPSKSLIPSAPFTDRADRAGNGS